VLADYHMHTTLCRHAHGTPEEYAAAAVRKGLAEICFTDHVPLDDQKFGPTMLRNEFPAYQEMIARCRASAGLPVLFGIEADFWPEQEFMDLFRDWLPAQPFDVVLGSVHAIRGWVYTNGGEALEKWKTVDVAAAWREYFDLVGQMADTRLFDIVTHLDAPKHSGYRPPESQIPEIVQPALDRIAAAGMGIELNTSGLIRPCQEIYPSLPILIMARERGIPISFGSDSHGPADLGRYFDQALKLAKDAGYTHCLRMRGRKKQLVPLPRDFPVA
jgi:histidinol-phosphatase (PHP family)